MRLKGIDGENAATPKKRPRRSAALAAEALLISDIRTRRSDANTKETRRQTCSSNSTTLTTTPLAIVCAPFQSTQIATKASTYQQQRTSASTFALMPIEVEMAAKKVDASMTSIFGISSCGSWAVSNDFSETEQPSTPLSSTDAAFYNGQTESGEHSKTREQPFGPIMSTLEAANEPESKQFGKEIHK